MKRADAFELGWTRLAAGRPVSALTGDVSKELATALALKGIAEQIQPPSGAWESLGARIDAGERSNVVAIRGRRPHHILQVVVAVAAAFALLVAVSLRARPDSPLYRLRRASEQVALALTPDGGAVHLRLASARLDDLVFAMSKGDFASVPSLADALESERAAAVAGGADVQLLDARMVSTLTPALASAPANVAATVRDCLNDAIPDDDHDAPGDANNPDAASDEGGGSVSGVAPGQSAPSHAPSRPPTPSPSYSDPSDEGDS